MNVAKLVKSSLYNKHKYNTRNFQPSFSITMREKHISRVFVLLLKSLAIIRFKNIQSYLLKYKMIYDTNAFNMLMLCDIECSK